MVGARGSALWLIGAAVMLLLGAAYPLLAESSEPRLIVQDEYIQESGGRTFNDPSLYYTHDRFHAQAWFGTLTKGVEVGGYTKDRRNSSYGAFYRFRDGFDHVLQVETEQVTGTKGVVFATGVRYIHTIPDEGARNMLQFHVGADRYYGGYNFTSFRAISDPRRSGRWTFVISNRFARENSYLTVGLVPRTDGEIGYFVQAKRNQLYLGVGRYSRFDFTDRNRTIFNVGWEFDLE